MSERSKKKARVKSLAVVSPSVPKKLEMQMQKPMLPTLKAGS